MFIQSRKCFLSLVLLTFIMKVCIASSIYIDHASERIRVACVGDSITFGALIENAKDKYPYQLGQFLGQSYEVKNFGFNGATLLENGDYSYRKQLPFKAALEFNPHIVVIALGTNDTKPHNWKFKDQFHGDYNRLIKTFKDDYSNRHVFLCLPPVMYALYSNANAIVENEIIPLIKK